MFRKESSALKAKPSGEGVSMVNARTQARAEYTKYLEKVRWVQKSRATQNALYRNAGTQNLTWDVLFLIAEAQYAGQNLNVSDICVSVAASKSTTLKLIAQLATDSVIDKRQKENDSRTQLVTLHDTFRKKLEHYLDTLSTTFPALD
jgi:DNA-binding MarR family transcriptional regulator|tara:strand:+ start:1238 stop:1678 length:441 start_codon:yes stop_codon:yes gene_type:complete